MATPQSPSYRKKQISMRNLPQVENVAAVKTAFNRHLHHTIVKDRHVATGNDFYRATAYTVRDRVVGRWIRTQQHYYSHDPKVEMRVLLVSWFLATRIIGDNEVLLTLSLSLSLSLSPLSPSLPPSQRVYYLSMEFLMGRSLTNAMVNLGMDSEVEEGLYEVNLSPPHSSLLTEPAL